MKVGQARFFFQQGCHALRKTWKIRGKILAMDLWIAVQISGQLSLSPLVDMERVSSFSKAVHDWKCSSRKTSEFRPENWLLSSFGENRVLHSHFWGVRSYYWATGSVLILFSVFLDEFQSERLQYSNRKFWSKNWKKVNKGFLFCHWNAKRLNLRATRRPKPLTTAKFDKNLDNTLLPVLITAERKFQCQVMDEILSQGVSRGNSWIDKAVVGVYPTGL